MKIGNIELKGKIIQGPMAGVSDEAFRLINKEHGAALVCTEMISIEGLIRDNKKTQKMIKVNSEEHPVSLQLFGNNVEAFEKGVKFIEEFSDCDIIDLNIGCPVPKVAIKSQSGSQLLNNPSLIYEIVKVVVENTTKPVTAKIRLGWDRDNVNVLEVAKLIEQAGASALIVHARTRSDFYSGHADWKKIKEVKQILNIPVIGNGDVTTPKLAQKMLNETGCDGVMISRGCQGNPWIFEQCNFFIKNKKYLPKITYLEWKKTVLKHLTLLIDLKGIYVGVKEFRKHLIWYLDVLGKNSLIKELKIRANSVMVYNDILKLLEEYERGL